VVAVSLVGIVTYFFNLIQKKSKKILSIL
jgi:hypothetical protein